MKLFFLLCFISFNTIFPIIIPNFNFSSQVTTLSSFQRLNNILLYICAIISLSFQELIHTWTGFIMWLLFPLGYRSLFNTATIFPLAVYQVMSRWLLLLFFWYSHNIGKADLQPTEFYLFLPQAGVQILKTCITIPANRWMTSYPSALCLCLFKTFYSCEPAQLVLFIFARNLCILSQITAKCFTCVSLFVYTIALEQIFLSLYSF